MEGNAKTTYIAVRERLNELLAVRRMSIHKLAMESSVSPSTIKNILYGKSVNPGIATIKMLCDGLGVTLTEFFGTPDFASLAPETG